jgi:hypothetical protein
VEVINRTRAGFTATQLEIALSRSLSLLSQRDRSRGRTSSCAIRRIIEVG